MIEIKVDKEKCDGCGTCVDICSAGILKVKNGKSVAENPDQCILCRACEASCPNHAINPMES